MTALAVSLTAALVLAGCGGDSGDSGGGDSGGGGGGGDSSGDPGSDINVGVAYDVGGRGDQSFNDSAAAGLDQAVEEFGINVDEAEAGDGEDDAAREERLRLFAENGNNPVIAVGFVYATSLAVVAEEFPDTQFALIDSADATADNITNLLFAEEQGSFLVGVIAALKSTTKNVGFVGGVQVPLIEKFEAGFAAGVAAVDPAITVQVQYLTQPPDFSGFGDPAKGKTAAEGMYQNGADIVYQAAGGSGGGVFEAASEAGAFAIGVDSDQAVTADPAVADVIISSMLKNLNVAVSEFLSSFVDGDVQSGEVIFDLSNDGVGYSTTGGQIDDIAAQVDEFKQQIIDGEIEVPTTP
ncbi:MAG: BMP family ABC transporter substrate-binding protein [Geodermatophilaceae bacterium]|nr:BMP family ABC transporter substrate-binding protein [Geodermatophilaceae bacterium]